MNPDPFAALGLPTRPDLSNEEVRAAWRSIAAATHPDRPDGGDLARYTAASAAYAQLRTPWARSEAYADLLEQNDIEQNEPDTSPLPPVPAGPWPTPVPPWQPLIKLALISLAQIPARIRRGRPLRLAIRGAVAAALSLVVLHLHLTAGTAAGPADVFGLAWWFVLTGRKDLAPPPRGAGWAFVWS